MRHVSQPKRGDWDYGNTFIVHQERIFIGPMGRSAILDHAKPAGGYLLIHAMIEQQDAVCHIFFQTVPGKSFFTNFGGDHERLHRPL